MELADLPIMMPVPWARDATDPTFVRTVPIPSEIGSNPGFASFETGFVPLNMTPLASGGIPPFGQDSNGVLRAITQWLRWAQAGAPVAYSAAFSTEIGGYPDGALVPSAATPYLRWLSTVDNNATDPDAGGAGWIPVWDRPRIRNITATGAFTTLITDQFIGLARAGATSSALPSTNLFEGFAVTYSDLLANLQANQHTVTAPGGHVIAGGTQFIMNTNRQTSTFRYFGEISAVPTWGVDV